MSKLVKFTLVDANGKKKAVYINPDHVLAVSPMPVNNMVEIVLEHGIKLSVEEKLDDVVEVLNDAIRLSQAL